MADNSEAKTHLPGWAVVLVVGLAVVTLASGAVAGVALQQTTELRDDLQSEIEKRESSTALLTTLITTTDVGAQEVQQWIDSGLVRIPPPDPGEIRTPLGCFAGDVAVWNNLFGLSC